MKVDKIQYDSFPSDFEVTNNVFQFYYSSGDLSRLSDPQRALCYFFICEGLIDNGGFYSILLETEGKFNWGYITSLENAGEAKSQEILQQIHHIYEQFEGDFSHGELPPPLDDESDQFDQKLSDRIDVLEEKWYAQTDERILKMNNYFANYKDDLIKIT